MAVAESCAEGASRRTDVADFLLLGVGIFSLIFAVAEGQTLGWDSAPTLGSGRYRALYCNRGVTGRYTSAVSKHETVALSPELSTTKQVVTLSRRDLSFEPHVLQIDREPEVFHPTEQLCRLEELLDVEHARFARGRAQPFSYQCRYDPGGAGLPIPPESSA